MTFHFWSSFVASLFRGMRDLLLNMPSRRFHFSPTVVIFCLRDGSVASLFHDMRDLLTSGALGRFTPASAVVIFLL